MGAVRHRELIRLLAFVVAMDMAIGVVALVVRSEDGSRRARTAQFAGSVGIPLDSENGGVLAGGNFSKRRGLTDSSATPATGAPASSTTAPGGTPGGGAPTPTTGRPADTTLSTAAPGTTATTQAPPGTTATTRAAPTGTTTSNGRPGTRAAPPATTATSGPAAAGRHQSGQADPAGDTVIDGTQDPIKEGRADIVRAGAAYQSGAIVLAWQVARPTDPRKDARWAGESTFVNWSIDTNGDGTPDFDIQYYFDGTELGGTVSRPGSEEEVCEASDAAYSPDGYSFAVPPSCLGDPASFSYRVTTYYDTNPKDANADVASDVTPNGGLSFPISRPS